MSISDHGPHCTVIHDDCVTTVNHLLKCILSSGVLVGLVLGDVQLLLQLLESRFGIIKGLLADLLLFAAHFDLVLGPSPLGSGTQAVICVASVLCYCKKWKVSMR